MVTKGISMDDFPENGVVCMNCVEIVLCCVHELCGDCV